jgi:L-lactate dehydrogenase (cytochrome)
MRLAPDRPMRLVPATVLDYRELARRRLPRQLFDYADGGSYAESTMRANVLELERLRLRQRVLRDVSVREQAVEVAGQRLSMPVILGPVGLGGMYARRGEVQAARAALSAGIAFVESTVSICSIEEVAREAGTPPWFQLYVIRDRGYAESLIVRARDVGAPVLVLTVDMAVPGARHRDTRNALVGSPPLRARLLRGLDLAAHPAWIREVGLGGRPLTFGNLEAAVPGAGSPAAFRAWVDSQFDPSVSWKDVAWIRSLWPGRLLIKGLLDPEDARHALDSGADGIIVSNHGGRQLDAVPASVAALPGVVDAVGDQLEVLVDGGVRSGLDVVKLLALGARAVLLGRAWVWALAAGGERAVEEMLARLRADLDVALALTGHTSVAALDRDALAAAAADVAAAGS